MTPKRRKDVAFTVDELHQIQAAIVRETSPRFLTINGQDFEEALAYQHPYLYHSWKAFERAEADFLYCQGILDEYIKEKQQCQSET